MRLCILCIYSFLSVSAFASEHQAQTIPSFDGFEIGMVVDIPQGMKNEDVKKVVIYVHGSGPQNFDEDLSALTSPQGSKNLFFHDIAEALLKKNIASVRYNKRSYEIRKEAEDNLEFLDSPEAKKYKQHPLEYTVKDCAFFVELAHRKFPNAEVVILGHSEGTRIALNVAKDKSFVKGVVLIGFSNENLASSLLEQVVYREQSSVMELDKNHDGKIQLTEVQGDQEMARILKSQWSILDQDGDQILSVNEINAANYMNLLLQKDLYNSGYAADEALMPRSSEIIQAAKFQILFLQGEYDNQTPVFYAQSIELANRVLWKKQNLRFVYFAKSGHALDPRQSLHDLKYSLPPKERYDRIAEEIASL